LVFDLATGLAQGPEDARVATHAAKVEGGRVMLDAGFLARRSAA
jgi:nitrite reductase (NADH) small subunit